MARKYEHLFNLDPANANPLFSAENKEDSSLPNISQSLALMNSDVYDQSKIFLTAVLISPSSEKTFWVPDHRHQRDEIISFVGTDPENPKDLGAELFMTIEDEEYTITTSGSVYIPAGLDHCPLGWNWIERPFMFSILYLNGSYDTDEHDRHRE